MLVSHRKKMGFAIHYWDVDSGRFRQRSRKVGLKKRECICKFVSPLQVIVDGSHGNAGNRTDVNPKLPRLKFRVGSTRRDVVSNQSAKFHLLAKLRLKETVRQFLWATPHVSMEKAIEAWLDI